MHKSEKPHVKACAFTWGQPTPPTQTNVGDVEPNPIQPPPNKNRTDMASHVTLLNDLKHLKYFQKNHSFDQFNPTPRTPP